MNTVQTFDEFLLRLHHQIERSPSQRKRIIQQALQDTACPYLKQKLISFTNYQ